MRGQAGFSKRNVIGHRVTIGEVTAVLRAEGIRGFGEESGQAVALVRLDGSDLLGAHDMRSAVDCVRR